jgi:hypothetical protein
VSPLRKRENLEQQTTQPPGHIMAKTSRSWVVVVVTATLLEVSV